MKYYLWLYGNDDDDDDDDHDDDNDDCNDDSYDDDDNQLSLPHSTLDDALSLNDYLV